MRTRKTLFALLISIGLGFCTLTSLHAAFASHPLISVVVSGTSVKLSYKSTSKVSGYEVSMATSPTATPKVIYTGSKTSASITKLTYGNVVVFQVRSYVEVNKIKTYSDPVSLTVEVKLAVPVLNGTLSKSVTTLSWAKITGTSGYEVYRSSAYAGSYTLIKTAATPKYSEKLGLGVKSYYKIRAYVTVGGKKIYSEYSNIILISN